MLAPHLHRPETHKTQSAETLSSASTSLQIATKLGCSLSLPASSAVFLTTSKTKPGRAAHPDRVKVCLQHAATG